MCSSALQVEDVLNVIEKERPEGIIVQFGGQTPLSIAKPLAEALAKNPIPAASGVCLFNSRSVTAASAAIMHPHVTPMQCREGCLVSHALREG